MDFITEASHLNEHGVKLPQPPKKDKGELVIPDDLAEGLKKSHAAQATFDKFSNTNKREYVVWINEAKTEETRERRLETALEWMAEGKERNWKYARK